MTFVFLKPLPFPFDSDFNAKAAHSLARRHGSLPFTIHQEVRRYRETTPVSVPLFEKMNHHLRDLVKKFTYALEIGLGGGLESLSKIMDESENIESLFLQVKAPLHGAPKAGRFFILRYLAQFNSLRELGLRRAEFESTFLVGVSSTLD
ncbi:hypothetical protein BT69DRAFT_1304417 [Atractiella rhizophila]|nr:hypothetical protein BT69DRAFT_1304573 [Atractiella rhizophila]KAH8914917.1 hypothetical protein BT69DRAFT_1304417 [Atractiella rhizophila]